MAQFALHRNKDARTKAVFPLLVDVQSDLLDDLSTRVVIPLSKATALVKKPVSRLMPIFEIEKIDYVLVTPQLAGISRNLLGPEIGSLVRRREDILSAMDFLFTGF